ncbi:radical SAM protein [Chlamydiota bacterium]
MIIHKTTTICNSCNASHPAELIKKENNIIGVVDCPKGRYEYNISTDAEMFLKLRKRCFIDFAKDKKENSRYILNYISITNACNLNCTVCGAGAKKRLDDAVFLSVDEICRRAKEVKQKGGRVLHFFGGEPTLHPDLLEIVQRISRMGFSTGLVTNGYLLGKDNTLAEKLKKRGLKRICMQFDSFNEDTLNKLGRGYLKEKNKAIQNVINAGLNLGLNCTTTKYNLYDLSQLLSHGLKLGPYLKNMTFASAAPVGRYLLSNDDCVNREQMIAQLLKAGDKFKFSFDDIMPLPSYLPWGVQIHPDCGVHIILIRKPDNIRPLNYYVNVRKLYRCMGANKMKPGFVSCKILPIFYVLKSMRENKILECLKVISGLCFKRKKYSLVNIGISDYKAAMFLDEQRIRKCASAFYTSVGPVKACLHFLRDQNFPGSCEWVESHGSC